MARQYHTLHLLPHSLISIATIVRSVINDDDWLRGEFLTTVQQRGAAIIKARKLSSAASAANAVIDHVRSWALGTPEVSLPSLPPSLPAIPLKSIGVI